MNYILKDRNYYIAMLLWHFVLPYFLQENKSLLVLNLIVGNVLFYLILAGIYGYRKHISWRFILIGGTIYLLSLFVHYNFTASIYVLFYAIVSLASMFLANYMKHIFR